MAKVRLLFVCVENSCRSQMAEGFARHYGGEAVDVHSAGSAPSGKVNPQAVELMRERDIDIEGQRSNGLDNLPSAGWDWVVTMGCGDACPQLPTKNRADWQVDDPFDLPIERFRAVRDDIERRVAALLRECGLSVDL